jgi:DNA-directed RNA polymerase specialized sigma24 family protein
MAKTRTQPLELDQSKALAGVLALLAADREERIAANEKGMTRTEVILGEAGLNATEVARLLGKPEPGVRKAIQRGRAARSKGAKSGD